MKISLERLDTRALRVELPGRQALAIRASEGLRGVLERSGDRLALSDVAAESIELDTLRLLLGALVLSSEAGATLTGLGVSLEHTSGGLVLSATLASLVAEDLEVAIDDVRVRGRVTLTAPELAVHGDEGRLSAAHVEFSGFALHIGGVALAATSLRGSTVQLGWGAAGFWLHAAELEAPALRLTTAGVDLTANGAHVRAFALDGKKITVGGAAIAAGQVAVELRRSSGADAAPASSVPLAGPLFDWQSLDTLSGQLDVDAAVDLTVPIIGRRKATHRLRVPIEGGTIDYRALEHNLATLEDALLDFSVRDGALVLERVNPLFPARGRGKPVVIWDLDAAGLELALRDRVRLAVLPRARLAAEPPEGEREREPSKSSIALRELGLLRINARLALATPAPPPSGQVRLQHVGSLGLAGNVFH
ncbi:hypothetical protein BH11MYX4_BH11MYX4_26010 [soil metagenome]